MMPTPASLLPPSENKRLATLRSYDILHSLQEPLFTEVVEVIATLYNVPISLIALVDADEVEYKAVHGLPGLRSQPRAEAICAMAIKQQQPIVFPDLSFSHALTAEAAAAAQAKGLVFYAGVPLWMPNRHCIGTLCIIDKQSRTFSTPEERMLEQFAYLVGRLIAVRQYCRAGQAAGEEYWSVVRTELTLEVQALRLLVRNIVRYVGTHIPVHADVLEAVDNHLNDLRWRLADYYSGPL